MHIQVVHSAFVVQVVKMKDLSCKLVCVCNYELCPENYNVHKCHTDYVCVLIFIFVVFMGNVASLSATYK